LVAATPSKLELLPSERIATEGNAPLGANPFTEYSEYIAPSAWLYQLEKFAPVMLAASAARVTCEASVLIYELAKAAMSFP
jgi:hypothetical protein